MSKRSAHNRAILGPELYKRVRECKLLVVGAGGIGCELLKNLVLVGFGNIEVIDLDTIDLSNLNRQFLFRKADIKKSKAKTAALFVKQFNPGRASSSTEGEGEDLDGVKIKATHGNIFEKENDVAWYKGFDMVLSALDNVDARRHVNKMCCAAGVPLIESGTSGYLGQVTPILKGVSECFDCKVKPVVKTFPVCTLRATPSEPIHCIVWGKTYLFGKLFGEDDEANDTAELEKARAEAEDSSEIDKLKAEASAFAEVRQRIGEDDGARRAFEKVFADDINRLLSMEDMWKVPGRVKPTPLDYEAIMDGSFVVPPVIKKAAAAAVGEKEKEANGTANGNGNESGVEKGAAGLKDQQELSVKENLELFMSSCDRLSARAISHPKEPLAFDKDDDDTLDFVLATSNLRSMAYGIATKTRFQVKEMAGNIIPAIATTNAVIAGFIVMQALNILRDEFTKCKNVFLKANPNGPIGFFNIVAPNAACGICQDTYIPLQCDTSKLTLGTFVEDVLRGWLGWNENEEGDAVELSVYEGTRVLADPDFDDNYGKTLEELGIGRGKMITVSDEDEVFATVNFAVCDLDPNAMVDQPFSLPKEVPVIPKRYQKPKEPTPSPGPEIVDRPSPAPAGSLRGKKRTLEDGDEPSVTSSKKAKTKGKAIDGDTEMVDVSDDEFEIL